MKKHIVGLVIILALAVSAEAQLRDLKFKRYFTSEGLSSNILFSICKDYKGYMWFGTRDGLNKFDGYKFTVYKHDPNNAASLRNNMVRTIFEDSQRNLWIGTFDGTLHRYNRSTDSFTAYSSGDKEISDIYEDSQQRLWVGTYGNGLMLFDRTTNSFSTQYTSNPEDPNTIIGNFVRTLVEDKQGYLWVGDGKSGLSRLNHQKNNFTRFNADPAKKDGLLANDIYALYVDQADRLWIGTELHGLSVLNKERSQYTNYLHNPAEASSLVSNGIKDIVLGPDGNVWIGTHNGLSILDRHTNRFVNFLPDLNDPQSLSHNSLEALYTDPAGAIWLAAWNGLNLHYPSSFAHYRNDYRDPTSMMKNRVSDFLEDRDGNLWITLDPGGLELFDRENNHFTHFTHNPKDKNSLSGNIGLNLAEDKQGNILIGTCDGGLAVYDKKSGQFTSYQKDPADTTTISSQAVSVVLQDYKENLWLATWNNGLNLLDRKTGKSTRFVHNPANPNSLSSNVILSMFEDSRHNLWLGTLLKGLELFNPETRTFTHIAHHAQDSTSLSNNNVTSLFEDSQRNLWVGTEGGLNSYDYNKGTFVRFGKKDGLPGEVIRAMLEDGQGNLWISTDMGLSRFNPQTKTFKNYTSDHGLQGDDFMNGAALKTRNGEMYFGGSNGFNIFHPDSIRENDYVPPVYITDLQIFNQSVQPGAQDSLLRAPISEAKEITLSYKQSVVSFEFAALNFISSHRNQYAYKLEGFDKSWNYVGSKRHATYTNLDPGVYTFRVKAANNDVVWNEQGASLKLIITPPFWQTWWFRLLAGMLILGGAFAFYRIRINAIKDQKVELENQVIERTAEILQQKEEILAQAENLQTINEELQDSQEEIKVQRDNLQKINEHVMSSIQYANTIQKAILPSRQKIQQVLPDHFIIYRPKDVVSGDFYWFCHLPKESLELNQKRTENIDTDLTFMAVVDCTGHGVPGAFMSIIGNTLLNEIINQKHILDPAQILEELDKGVRQVVGEAEGVNTAGMDVCLIRMQRGEGNQVRLLFCGAKRPLHYVPKAGTEVLCLDPDRRSIGSESRVEKIFTTQEILVEAGSTLYLSTDGYTDQNNQQREKLGTARIKELMLEAHSLPLIEKQSLFEAALDEHQEGAEQRDDITLMGIRL